MKKKLEAELISIAHRILKMKNKSDVISLHQETQKLYEKLSILRFVEEQFGEVKPTIGTAEVESKFEDYFEAPPTESNMPEVADVTATKDVPADEPEIKELPEETPEVTENSPEEDEEAPAGDTASEDEIENEKANQGSEAEETTEIPEDVPPSVIPPDVPPELETAAASAEDDRVRLESVSEGSSDNKKEAFIPSFELSFEAKTDEEHNKPETKSPQFSFDDLLGKDYADPVFVKPDEVQPEKKFSDYTFKDAETIQSESKAVSLNDRLSKGITIGLNDRIAFIKHLFADSSEDYNRVLSQLMTFDTYDEAQNFIADMVKPDYNNWQGKEEYEQRFMEIVEKRFS
ncbi:MAG TPA: hypothetical protein VF676_07500 [Flavobacterium sp.]|jgi:hypothetical protein